MSNAKPMAAIAQISHTTVGLGLDALFSDEDAASLMDCFSWGMVELGIGIRGGNNGVGG